MKTKYNFHTEQTFNLEAIRFSQFDRQAKEIFFFFFLESERKGVRLWIKQTSA